MSIEVHADRELLRGPDRSERYLLIALEAPVAPADSTRSPLNAALVLDRSGSMRGSTAPARRRRTPSACSSPPTASASSPTTAESR